MNEKRKSELQRRLSMTRVPKPPHDLARRIKDEIPELLDTSRERDRLNRSIGFNLRVAASILLLVGGTVFTLNLFTRARESERAGVTAVSTMASDAAKPAESKKELFLAEPAAPPAAPLREASSAPAPPPPPPVMTASLKDRTRGLEAGNAASKLDRSSAVAQTAQVAAAAREEHARADDHARAEGDLGRAESENIVATAEAPLIQPSPAAPAAKTTVADLQQNGRAREPRAADEKTRSAAAPAGAIVGGVVPSAAIAETRGMAADRMEKRATVEQLRIADRPARQTSDRRSAFGISTDPTAFDRIRTAIEKGQRPDAAAVDIEALVNYFAGPPRRAPRHITLDVEGSLSPVQSSSREVIVRATIDTPHVSVRPDGGAAPVATNGRLEIEFDPAAVAAQTPAGEHTSSSATQPLLVEDTSVTALYHVRLQQTLSARQRVAVIRLHYRPAGGGAEKTITRVLRVSDLLHGWADASPRHRRASLGAVWGETLRGAANGNDVAMRAEELARQQPDDARARELATLSSASSRLRTSAPTGSGR
jgi:hypothetical protein